MKNNQGSYKFALIDYQMPELSGVEVLRRMNDNNFFGVDFPVLFSSLAVTPEVETELNKSGLTRNKVWRLDKGPMKTELFKESLSFIENNMEHSRSSQPF